MISHIRLSPHLRQKRKPDRAVAKWPPHLDPALVDDAEEVWNRATTGGGTSPGEGDAALSAALAFHSLAMNGGVLHAYEVLTAEELGRARDGFAWLALTDVAAYLEATAQQIETTNWDDEAAVDTLEASAGDGYQALLPDDATLESAFRSRLAEHPEAFHAL